MDISRANTEPLYRFKCNSEGISRSLRVLVGGVASLRNLAHQQRDIGKQTQLEPDGEPWPISLLKDATQSLDHSKRILGQMGVVWTITAFEEFCSGVRDEHDRHSNRVNASGARKKKEKETKDEGLSLEKLYKDLNFATPVLDNRVFYEYFEKLRNCIIHRSGRASKTLEEYAARADLKQCFVKLNELKGSRNLPLLPDFSANDDVPLLPRHAIFAIDVCRQIAVDANSQLVKHLGDEGMVYMAAYHSLLSTRPIETKARKSARAVVNSALQKRYRVELGHQQEAETILANLRKWKDCLRSFEKRQV